MDNHPSKPLKGKCRLCKSRVTLRDGRWSHDTITGILLHGLAWALDDPGQNIYVARPTIYGNVPEFTLKPSIFTELPGPTKGDNR